MSMDSAPLAYIYKYLSKRNLTKTLETLANEARLERNSFTSQTYNSASLEDLKNLLSIESNVDDSKIPDIYDNLLKYIETVSESIRAEFALTLYPFFVHLYLHLVCHGKSTLARSFFNRFNIFQDTCYRQDIIKLGCVLSFEHIKESEFVAYITENKFTINLCTEAHSCLKRFLENTQENSILMTLLLQNIRVVVQNKTRSKSRIADDIGSMLGETGNESNLAKIMYGVRISEENTESNKHPTKITHDINPNQFNKKFNDLVCPPIDRIPYHEYNEQENVLNKNRISEKSYLQPLSSTSLPSTCMYTFFNCKNRVTCASFSQDSTHLCAGFSDSFVKIWSLTFQKLRTFKDADELQKIDKEGFDVFEKVLSDGKGTDTITLTGHTGPIFGLSFNPYNSLLLSGSADGNVRLWHIVSQSCISIYKSHILPIWDVKFCPRGYYFCSAGYDNAIRLWSIERDSPLRVFVGHCSDVLCVQFHPNSNYVASGSNDRTVRIWDISSGNSVRTFSGFKSPIRCIEFSPDGKYIIIGEQSGTIHMYDIPNVKKLTSLVSHTSAVTSINFSQDHTFIATGGLDNCVKLWNYQEITHKLSEEEVNETVEPISKSDATFYTKTTPVYSVNFNFRNVLTCCGPFDGV